MPNAAAPSSFPSATAWLERPEGEIIPLDAPVSFGRASGNTILLDNEGISRRHATIHRGGPYEYWLIDLGSSNGTKLNGQRISQPTRLRQDDVIELAKQSFRFVCPAEDGPSSDAFAGTLMMRHTTENRYWIVIADICDFTGLSRRLPGAELHEYVDRWLKACKPIVEGTGARFIKFLGDGFFAAMPDGPETEVRIAGIVRGLSFLSARGNPTFRIVVHEGIVAVGAAPLLNEESFIGAEVNFAFRMEKVTAGVGATAVLSEPAAARLHNHLQLTELPMQRVKGFDAEYRFFRVVLPEAKEVQGPVPPTQKWIHP